MDIEHISDKLLASVKYAVNEEGYNSLQTWLQENGKATYTLNEVKALYSKIYDEGALEGIATFLEKKKNWGL